MSRYVEIPDGDCRVIVFDGNTKSVIDKCYDSEDKGADVAPIIHAAWEYLGVSDGHKIYSCTHCKSHIYGTHPYCKECGAKMDGGTK